MFEKILFDKIMPKYELILLFYLHAAVANNWLPYECRHPISAGACNNTDVPPSTYHVRWAYNITAEICQPFEYIGCGGNKNNFANEVDCDETCVQPFMNVERYMISQPLTSITTESSTTTTTLITSTTLPPTTTTLITSTTLPPTTTTTVPPSTTIITHTCEYENDNFTKENRFHRFFYDVKDNVCYIRKTAYRMKGFKLRVQCCQNCATEISLAKKCIETKTITRQVIGIAYAKAEINHHQSRNS
ncbi:hypothetical protein GJ496_005554 [Pomphorhynchus laevis]|nr:hypothetical protein GJ496_005554 [Pomphorhynchus laevis]